MPAFSDMSTVEKQSLTLSPSSREILRSTAFFRDLTATQLERMTLLGRVETYPQDASVYTLGQAADDFYVLVDGMVRFTIGLGNRSTHAGQVLKRGEVFGWAALVESAHTRIATARAITPCTVLALNGEQMNIMMDEDNGLGYRLMRELNELITGNLTAFAAG
jgi:toluene monooxygenase system ferredoxin subunit